MSILHQFKSSIRLMYKVWRSDTAEGILKDRRSLRPRQEQRQTSVKSMEGTWFKKTKSMKGKVHTEPEETRALGKDIITVQL